MLRHLEHCIARDLSARSRRGRNCNVGYGRQGQRFTTTNDLQGEPVEKGRGNLKALNGQFELVISEGFFQRFILFCIWNLWCRRGLEW